MENEWEKFKSLGTKFMVAGRLCDKSFRELGNLSIPKSAEALFENLPEDLFREDISSTQLRGGIEI
jgi:hypothetical protein